jgi:hypothetical protein
MVRSDGRTDSTGLGRSARPQVAHGGDSDTAHETAPLTTHTSARLDLAAPAVLLITNSLRCTGTATRRAISLAAKLGCLCSLESLDFQQRNDWCSTIARSDPNRFSNCRPSSTALVPLKPTRTRIATSSASVRACAPRDKSRSRGRSSCGHETIPCDLVVLAAIRSVPLSMLPRTVRRMRSRCGVVGIEMQRAYV